MFSDGDPWYTARLETARLGVIDPNDENFVPQPGHTTLAYVHGSSGRPDVVLNSQGNGVPDGHLGRDPRDGRGRRGRLRPGRVAAGPAGVLRPAGACRTALPARADHGAGAAGHRRALAQHRAPRLAWKHDSEFIEALARIPSGPLWVRALEAVEPVLAKQYRFDEREAWLRLVREHTAAA